MLELERCPEAPQLVHVSGARSLRFFSICATGGSPAAVSAMRTLLRRAARSVPWGLRAHLDGNIDVLVDVVILNVEHGGGGRAGDARRTRSG